MKAIINKIFTLSSKWNEYNNKDKERYEGSLSISLMMGKLNWDIKSDWLKEYQKQMEKDLNTKLEMVYTFGHHTIHIKYIFRNQSGLFFNSFEQFISKKLS